MSDWQYNEWLRWGVRILGTQREAETDRQTGRERKRVRKGRSKRAASLVFEIKGEVGIQELLFFLHDFFLGKKT